MFITGCADGAFGYNCESQCHCEYNVSCDKIAGGCPDSKCIKNYFGPSCQTGILLVSIAMFNMWSKWNFKNLIFI